MVRIAPHSVPSPPLDAVLFDFRGTLFGIEDDPTGVTNAAASIGRSLTGDEAAALCAQLDATLAANPALSAALEHCDTSLDVHRDALLSWFAAAGLDDEL